MWIIRLSPPEPLKFNALVKWHLNPVEVIFDGVVLTLLLGILFFLLVGINMKFLLLMAIGAPALVYIAYRFQFLISMEAALRRVEKGEIIFDLDDRNWKFRERE